MTIHRKAYAFIVLSAISAALSLAGAQPRSPQVAQSAQSARTVALGQALPFDSQIATGTLPNGLRYYIRRNNVPQNRAELRLVVNAGSVLEDDDQQGLAHFVEHMAFNGSKHFARNELVRFMESIGMRMGPSVNAFTSFDETVYMLQLPTDKADVVDKAFLILEDWAHNLSFDPAAIDKERGVIIEEWRLGRGANTRMQDVQFPVLMKGSRYAARLPIGKKEIVETFKPDRLKQFYRDWYRPDLMAVVAVGDFDPPAIERLIRDHFAPIPNPANPRPRPVYDVPDHPGTLYAIATDKEATMTSVAVYNKLPLRDQATVGAYRQQIVDGLYLGMFNHRLSDLSRKPDPPFMVAGALSGRFVKSKEAATLTAVVKDGGIERGLEAVFMEAERVGRFGFTATELERKKGEVLRQYESLYAERDKHESATLAAEYIRNFTQAEPSPGIAYEYELQQRFLPEITLDEVNRVARAWTGDRSRVVLVSAPQKAGVAIPDEATLGVVMKSAAAKNVEPYVDSGPSGALLDAPPKGGAIAKTATNDAYGITEWDLSNGVKVVLKPTTFKADEVVFRATGFGGTSLASDKEFIAAMSAGFVIPAGGIGRFDPTELRKVLSGKAADVRPIISDTTQGLSGGASPKDLETLFQLIYLNFTQPRADPNIFAIVTGQMKSMLANQRANPAYLFAETLQTTLSQGHFRTRPMTPEIVDKEMDLDTSLAFYKARFADASAFTFFFVGSFDLATMKPLVEQYLGALPSTHGHQTWKDVGITPPRGVVKKTVTSGIEPKSQAAIVFTGLFIDDAAHRVAMSALGNVLQGRLRDRLRESLGGTYSVSVSPGSTKVPEPRYSLTIGFGCNPDRTDELVTAVFNEIDILRMNGPSEKQVTDVREQLLRDYETNMKQNGYLLAQIAQKYLYREDLKEIFDMPAAYRSLSPSAIRDAARTYLTPGNYVQVTLVPEKKTAPGLLDQVSRLLWPPLQRPQPVPVF
jgi:zinc protease